MGTGTQDTGGASTACQFTPEAYGAKGDNVTDDGAAVRSAVNAAVTYAQAHQGYAEVVFDATRVYLVNGALTQGGATKGNTLIPLPIIATTARKVTLVLRGTRNSSALMHWEATTVGAVGTVIRTTLTNGTNHVTYGAASVIGGPTPQQGYGLGGDMVFNNMHVVLDGISIQCPDNPTYCGFDFRGTAEVSVISGSAIVEQTPAGLTFANMGNHITNQWTFGLAMPHTDNNAVADIMQWSCEGFCYGLQASEHMMALSVKCIYNIVGINCRSSTDGTAMVHALHIAYACVEVCDYALSFNDGSSKVLIDCLDVENINLQYIYDPSNLGYGPVVLRGKNITSVTLTGGANLQVDNGEQARGHVNAPAIPASTVAIQNPFWRDGHGHCRGRSCNGGHIRNCHRSHRQEHRLDLFGSPDLLELGPAVTTPERRRPCPR